MRDKTKPTKTKPTGRKLKPGKLTAPSTKMVDQLAAMVRQEIRAKLGPNSTFEQRRDAAAELMRAALWKDADTDLRESVTDEG